MNTVRSNIPPPPQEPTLPLALPNPQQTPSAFSLKPPKKRRLGLVCVLFLVFGAVLVATGLGAYWWYQNSLEPLHKEYSQIAFDVTPGENVEAVAYNLEKAGIVRSAFATQTYIRLNNKDHIQAGHYLLSPGQPVKEIIQWLNEGRTNTRKVTILPGKTVDEIKQTLIDVGYAEAEVAAALAKDYDHPVFSNKPPSTSLEGYIYPDTYFAAANDSVETLLTHTFDLFEQKIKEAGIRANLAAQGLNLYEAITLASLVYGEVPNYDDQRTVAQVFLSRLAEDMLLGSDVSFTYASKKLGVPVSPLVDSPYNTRLVKGLPPGPVSNIPITALQAVINPTNTTYLFFVSGDDGTTHFAHTFAEHEQNVQRYCSALCE
ncbi:MAG TPA: endolytic transglycosylase MltG [Candidatus Saccharimonadales bacterium]|nr:endolytic transglycosylase MltG [Candidatus Saccharimonadales bacterium]